jgi:hypothetical protein
MEKATVLEIIKMLDKRIETAQYEYLDAYMQFRNELQEYIEQQDKPGCDYCKSIGKDCYCCAADE